MPEFTVGNVTVGANPSLIERGARLAGAAVDLLIVAEERLQGKVTETREPTFIDKKALEVVAEKLVGKTPGVGAVLDTLFSGAKLNNTADLPRGIGPTGQPAQQTATVDDGGQQPVVVMLPMWAADP